MDTEEIKALVRETVQEAIAKDVLRIVDKLSSVVESNQMMYDKHLSTLENARDAVQRENVKLIELIGDITRTMNEVRADNRAQIAAYREELHSAKAAIKESQERYFKFIEERL